MSVTTSRRTQQFFHNLDQQSDIIQTCRQKTLARRDITSNNFLESKSKFKSSICLRNFNLSPEVLKHA